MNTDEQTKDRGQRKEDKVRRRPQMDNYQGIGTDGRTSGKLGPYLALLYFGFALI